MSNATSNLSVNSRVRPIVRAGLSLTALALRIVVHLNLKHRGSSRQDCGPRPKRSLSGPICEVQALAREEQRTGTSLLIVDFCADFCIGKWSTFNSTSSVNSKILTTHAGQEFLSPVETDTCRGGPPTSWSHSEFLFQPQLAAASALVADQFLWKVRLPAPAHLKLNGSPGSKLVWTSLVKDFGPDLPTVHFTVSEMLQQQRQQSHSDMSGQFFQASKQTLCYHRDSMLAAYVLRHLDAGASLWIGRDGTRFETVLNYLRNETVLLDDLPSLRAVMEEAMYFGLDGLRQLCEEKIAAIKKARESMEAQSERELVNDLRLVNNVLQSTASEWSEGATSSGLHELQHLCEEQMAIMEDIYTDKLERQRQLRTGMRTAVNLLLITGARMQGIPLRVEWRGGEPEFQTDVDF